MVCGVKGENEQSKQQMVVWLRYLQPITANPWLAIPATMAATRTKSIKSTDKSASTDRSADAIRSTRSTDSTTAETNPSG